jgi:hypothetical protein
MSTTEKRLKLISKRRDARSRNIFWTKFRSFEGTELVPRLPEGNVRMHLEEMQRHAESGDDKTGKTCGYKKFCTGCDPSKLCLIKHHIVKVYEG